MAELGAVEDMTLGRARAVCRANGYEPRRADELAAIESNLIQLREGRLALLAQIEEQRATIERLGAAETELVEDRSCGVCGGDGGFSEERTCPACGGTGDERDRVRLFVEVLVAMVRRAVRGCDPRERAAIEADLERELRDRSAREAEVPDAA